jgi:uncharacterized protein (TIGR02757 family)
VKSLKERLEREVLLRNRAGEVSYARPDPVLVARRHGEPYAALACALFGYGRADAIVRFLDTLDMGMIDSDEATIRKTFAAHYYRFQNSEDVIQFFVSLRRLKRETEMEALFKKGYNKEGSVVEGINTLLETIRSLNPYESRGYRFLIGTPVSKIKGASPLKRWMMFLRWMVRDDAIDLGLWNGVLKSDLIVPLDTHTFAVSRRLGLLQRKQYDLQAAIELTDTLRRFDRDDPVKYDFALYRIGQEKMV